MNAFTKIISKGSINLLIDTLVKTSASKDPSGKLSEILRLLLNTDDINTIRTTLLLWLDTMRVLSYDRQEGKFCLHKPSWYPCAEIGKFILLGALTIEDIASLDRMGISKNQRNNIKYKNFLFELPDSYYTYDIAAVKELEFAECPYSLFSDGSLYPNKDDVTKNLISGILGISKQDKITKVNFIIDSSFAEEYILAQDYVQSFDWIRRNFIKTSIENEIEDPMGVKLIKVSKKKGGDGNEFFETFTLLLERNGKEWTYTYFDKSKIDERWARVIYLGKIQYYDIHKELRNRQYDTYGYLANNLSKIVEKPKKGASELQIEFGPDWMSSNEVLKIPGKMRQHFIRYDMINQLLIVPISLPLPQSMHRVLYSCSGVMPYSYVNKFRTNPKYILKLLFSGALSEGSIDIDYPEEPYYIEELLHLYRCVPPEIASILFKSLGLPFYIENIIQENN
jgi:hypothetical protein